jgi:hypothetical protein
MLQTMITTTYIEQKEEKKIINLQKACIETSKEKREKIFG